MFFEDNIDDSKYCGHLYGLGSNIPNNFHENNGENSNPAS